jgi:class 3 adenylate cyclase
VSATRPTSIATVMFTDLEGSTATTTRLGDDAAAGLFAQHDRIVRDAIAAHAGRQVRSTGDGFLVLFDSARSAVACAMAIQRELAAREDELRVRIGIGAGEVREGDGELFGAAINLAARVMDRAAGGQCWSPTPCASSSARCPARASATAAASR